MNNAHLKKVLQALEGGNKQNINSKDEDGNTALMLAVKNRDKEALKMLLEHKANVEAEDEDGKTALLLAAGSKEALEMLLKHGANVDAKDEDGNTVLMHAAKAGDKEVLKLLLKHNPNVNIQDEDLNGQTALMIFLSHGAYVGDGSSKMVQKLANKQTDFRLKDNAGNHPLHLAMNIIGAKSRQKACQHILGMMKQTLPGKINRTKLQKLMRNKAGKTPQDLLKVHTSSTSPEYEAYEDAYWDLFMALPTTP